MFIRHAGQAWAAPPAQLRGSVVDENGVPVPRVEVTVRTPAGQTLTDYTDQAGRFELASLAPGEHRVSLSKAGFFRLEDHAVQLKEGVNEVSFTLSHEVEIHEKVEVVSTSGGIEPQQAAHQEALVAHEIRDIPVPSTHDLHNSLPALPGVVRDTAAQLHFAGARAGETQYQLDGFEVGDPATGQLSARVNVDTVRAAEVKSGRYSAQYAHAGTGVLALDTAVGDDRWRFGATNFIPGINTDRGTHFGNWYPRVTFSGPLSHGRAWFSDAVSLQRTFNVVTEQPPGADTVTQWAGDNLLRFQVNLTPANILQANFLYNQSGASNLGLGPFSPLSTTTNNDARRYFVSAKDQMWLHRTLVEFGVAGDTATSEQLPQGPATYVILPNGAAGNFFEALHRRARRWQMVGNVVAASRHWHGAHDLSAGVNLASVELTQSALRGAIDVERTDTTLSQLTTFAGAPAFHISNTQLGGYVQDSWRIARPLILQAGLRTDWDRIVQHALAEPRIAANIFPFGDDRAKLALAWGIYEQAVPLDLLGQAFDQQRSDTFFDAAGKVAVLGPVTSQFALPPGGLKQPRFYTTSVEWTQKIGAETFAGVHFVARDEHDGLAYEDLAPAQPGGIFLLQNNRRDRYRAGEVSLRHSFHGKAEVFADYTRSRARTNEALDPTLGALFFAAQQAGPLAWDAPNRALSWGWTPLPFWHLWFSYFFEYRSGFPFNVVNQQQQLVGAPDRLRFPDYASLNLGIEKRFRLASYEFAARLTVVNITDHANPDAVINNVDAPNFLTFAGGQHRALTARLRFVGRK
jgi:hypothetical protein